MSELEQNNRYFRQEKILSSALLSNSKVLVVGAGGLGSNVLAYLGGAGVKHIIIADGDVPEIHNLQRQWIFTEQNAIDKTATKSSLAKEFLTARNSGIEVQAITEMLDLQALESIWNANQDIKLVIDCGDNGQITTALNTLAMRHSIKFIAGSTESKSGNIYYFDYEDPEYIDKYGCLCCIGVTSDLTKSTNQIQGPNAGVCGCLMAQIALEVLNKEQPFIYGKMLRIDNGRFKYFELCRDDTCQKHGRSI